MRALVPCLAFLVGLASAAGADVTMTSSTSGKAMGMSKGAEGVTYIKGNRMRSDSTMGDTQVTTIIDLDQQQFISINHKKREAEITEMAKLRDDLSKISDSEVTVKLAPTGQKKSIAGQTCDEYAMEVRVPMTAGNEALTIVMSGPVWVAKNSPGRADYAAFYRTAAEKGLFFTDPKVARAQPGNAKGMSALYRAMADAGVAYEMTMNVKFDGAGMMAGMMSKMGGSSVSTTVSSISTDPIGDGVFAIPTGYKTKTSR
jgi:hypothetical protein